MHPRFRIVCCLAILALSATAATAATFSDTQFLPADWSVVVETLNLGGNAVGSQVASGGNPGAFRRVDDILNSAIGQPFSNTVYGFHIRSGATWNPATQGDIVSISYTEDAFRFSGSGQQATGLALRQGGVIYYGSALLTPATVGVWQANSWPALTAANFDALAPGVQNPNFGIGGGVIEFGFFRANSTSVGGGGGTVSGGIDNWSVTVSAGATPARTTSWGRLKTLYRP